MSSSSQSMNDFCVKPAVPNHPKLQEHDYDVSETSIGRGNFGMIRTATRKAEADEDVCPSPIAVKIMQNYGGSDTAKFMSRELKAAPLKHKNIITIYGEFILSCDKYNIAFAMELADGNMDTWWESDRKHTTDDIEISLGQIVRGLAFLHDNKIVHNDLKGKNVLVVANKMKEGSELSFLSHPPSKVTLKLCDFGVARNVHTAISGQNGTKPYVAPERRLDQLRDDREMYSRGDIFSLAVLALKMVTGKEGPETDIEQVLINYVEANITDPRYTKMKNLILRMIPWKPVDRLSTGEVLSALTGLFPPPSDNEDSSQEIEEWQAKEMMMDQ